MLAQECEFSLEEYPDFAIEVIERIKAHVKSGRIPRGITVHGERPTFVSQTLRKARLDKGLTQVQVADAAEWTESKVIHIEQGIRVPSVPDLKELVRQYGIGPDLAAELRRKRQEK